MRVLLNIAKFAAAYFLIGFVAMLVVGAFALNSHPEGSGFAAKFESQLWFPRDLLFGRDLHGNGWTYLLIAFAVSLGWGVILTGIASIARKYNHADYALVAFVLAFGAWLVIPSANAARGARDRIDCQSLLKEIGFGLLEYAREHGTLPPSFTVDADGRPLQSWRTLLLPFVEWREVFEQIRTDEPWDSPGNKVAALERPPIYYCPGDRQAGTSDTSYVAIVGTNTAWRPDKGIQLSEVKDPANTVVAVEMKNSGIRWSEPRDLDLENLPPGMTRENLFLHLADHHDGFHALFADGHVEIIPYSISWSDFLVLTSISATNKPDRDQWWQ
jgi:prepilin-type processing-associated H-X9-DG protein